MKSQYNFKKDSTQRNCDLLNYQISIIIYRHLTANLVRQRVAVAIGGRHGHGEGVHPGQGEHLLWGRRGPQDARYREDLSTDGRCGRSRPAGDSLAHQHHQ